MDYKTDIKEVSLLFIIFKKMSSRHLLTLLLITIFVLVVVTTQVESTASQCRGPADASAAQAGRTRTLSDEEEEDYLENEEDALLAESLSDALTLGRGG